MRVPKAPGGRSAHGPGMAKNAPIRPPVVPALATPQRPGRREGSQLPNSSAIVNDRVNRMDPERYPPVPAWNRNENPPYPRLFETNYKNFTFKVES